MAHGGMINGTSYGITGGKAMLNGTVYGVDSGQAMSGGTVYPISFGEMCTLSLVHTFKKDSSSAEPYKNVGALAIGVFVKDRGGATLVKDMYEGASGNATLDSGHDWNLITGMNVNAEYEIPVGGELEVWVDIYSTKTWKWNMYLNNELIANREDGSSTGEVVDTTIETNYLIGTMEITGNTVIEIKNETGSSGGPAGDIYITMEG